MTTVEATPEQATKACTHCDQVKPLDEFAPNKRRRDGRQSWCRECRKMWIRHRRAVDTGMVERGVRQRRAHTRAAARLREAHPEEFDRYYAEEKAREAER